MTHYLVDSDAWLCLRKLSTLSGRTLLSAMHESTRSPPVLIGEYAARHELSSILFEILEANRRGQVKLCKVEARNLRFRELKRRIDKGEAEAIAWCLTEGAGTNALFVTRDSAALKLAHELRVKATDVLGAAVAMCLWGEIPREQLTETLEPWNDPSRENCRPRDWDGFESSFSRRHAKGFPFSP